MSSTSAPSWRWSRAISRNEEARWTRELVASGDLNWMIIESPARVRLRVEAYFTRKPAALAFERRFGGKIERFFPKTPAPSGPVRVGPHLEIVHDEAACRAPSRLIIPYGLAFGSGEHATTLMLLRALARKRDLPGLTVLDLGTGSGVLALTARKLGAKAVTATDFDPAAIRTARNNESLNFPSRRLRWAVGDVKQLRASPQYQFITANLFSGILVEASPRIVRALKFGGELWLSGVLRAQQEEVAAAYRKSGLRLLKTQTRGKWVMQQWTKRPRR